LVIALGGIKRGSRLDSSDDRVLESPLLLQFVDHVQRPLVLLLVAVKNDRPILLADVVALPVERGRIVHRKEDFQQVFVADNGWVESNLRYFNVPGLASAHLLVAWVLNVPAHVARDNALHTLQLVERSVHAPEASATEDRCLCHGVGLRTRYNNRRIGARRRISCSRAESAPQQ